MFKVGLIAIAAFSIALYARAHMEPVVKEPQEVKSLSLTPRPLPIAIDGTIVFDDAPAKNTQPFVLYGEMKADGTSAVKTKRLVFPSTYVCTVGDIPCASPNANRYPFITGDHVHVEGTADADVVYVSRLTLTS